MTFTGTPSPPMKAVSGKAAENWATNWLAAKDWEILARNIRTPEGEIDILATDPSGSLVVVEVKARNPLCWMTGEDALRPHQRRRLLRALVWMAHRLRWPGDSRLDLAFVHCQEDGTREMELLHGIGMD